MEVIVSQIYFHVVFFNLLLITSDKKPINEVILVSILYYDIEKINLDLTLMFLLSFLCFREMLF